MESDFWMQGTIEMQIFMTVSAKLNNEESIEFENNSTFWLPKGCDELNWPEGTAVLVKYRLIHDTIVKLNRLYGNKTVLFYYDRSDTLYDGDKDRKIYEKLHHEIREEYFRYIEVFEISKFIRENPLSDKFNREKAYRQWTTFYDEYKKQSASRILKEERFSFFLGAGVSASANMPSWKKLLDELCNKKKIPKLDNSVNNVVQGRYIINEYSDSSGKIVKSFYDDMRNILYSHLRGSYLIDVLAAVINKYWGFFYGHESIISYNYDDLVEEAINGGRSYFPSSYFGAPIAYPIYDKSRLKKKNGIPIYHVHGFVSHHWKNMYSSIVLGEKEYHKIYQESFNWGNVEQLHALTRSSCFFIGLSMTDPNLRRLIDISNDGGEVDQVHFAFLRSSEYNVPFMEQIMRSFGIHCIWYDEHDELPDLLADLWLKKSNRKKK